MPEAVAVSAPARMACAAANRNGKRESLGDLGVVGFGEMGCLAGAQRMRKFRASLGAQADGDGSRRIQDDGSQGLGRRPRRRREAVTARVTERRRRLARRREVTPAAGGRRRAEREKDGGRWIRWERNGCQGGDLCG